VQKPGFGELLFRDQFDRPQLWDTSSSPQASAAIDRSRLVLSITAPGPLSITSLRSEPVLADFFAEAVVSLSLCGGSNQFGMLFHAASPGDYYRFTVSCAGRVRLERSLSGSVQVLTDWLVSGDAPTAAPAEIKLGVWMVGGEMRAFINDSFQVGIKDLTLPQGRLGFFAYADGQQPVTISFSDLAVYTVLQPSPTP
jgi:hypothetical protein